MTSNILHHLNDLKTDWRRQNLTYTKEQQEAYSVLLDARREQVLGFYKDGRVFKGSKASADKIRDEELKANPQPEEDD
jgi:hypothetical protein